MKIYSNVPLEQLSSSVFCEWEREAHFRAAAVLTLVAVPDGRKTNGVRLW